MKLIQKKGNYHDEQSRLSPPRRKRGRERKKGKRKREDAGKRGRRNIEGEGGKGGNGEWKGSYLGLWIAKDRIWRAFLASIRFKLDLPVDGVDIQ